ncbi:MAG: hypothetical protein J6A83_05160 [Clostridia bacterium]|nr:hypothetical protein [Clostridia bacterium]
MNLNERSDKIRKLTVCAMMSALGVVTLYIGSLIEVLDISMAVIASLFVIFAVIEYGGAAPWAVYAVTGVLSAVLLPNKFPAAMYLLFFGFYPILKEKIEKLRGRVIQWAIKEAVFNVSLVLLMILARWLLFLESDMLTVVWIVFFLLANGTFVIYDIALTRLISLYVFKLRKKFRIK